MNYNIDNKPIDVIFCTQCGQERDVTEEYKIHHAGVVEEQAPCGCCGNKKWYHKITGLLGGSEFYFGAPVMEKIK